MMLEQQPLLRCKEQLTYYILECGEIQANRQCEIPHVLLHIEFFYDTFLDNVGKVLFIREKSKNSQTYLHKMVFPTQHVLNGQHV